MAESRLCDLSRVVLREPGRDGYKAIEYGKLMAVLVEAIRDGRGG